MVFRELILTMQKNIVAYFAHGLMLGLGLNILFSYQILTQPFSFWYYFAIALIVGFMLSFLFFDQKFQAKVTTKQKVRALLFGFTAASVVLAFLSFAQNLVWFISGGPLTRVMAPNATGGGYSRLTVYPPDLIFNLLKSTFFAAVAGFVERIVAIFA